MAYRPRRRTTRRRTTRSSYSPRRRAPARRRTTRRAASPRTVRIEIVSPQSTQNSGIVAPDGAMLVPAPGPRRGRFV